MALYIIASIGCLFGIGSLLLDGTKDQKPLWSLKFWCGVGALVMTLLLFFVANHDQEKENAAKAIAEANLATVRSNSDQIKRTQELQSQNQQLQLEKQEIQLAGAQDQAAAQKKQLELQAAQSEVSSRLIEAQRGEIQLLNRLTLNHNLLGLEVSFTPSPERWRSIARAFQNTSAPAGQGVSYVDAPMTAERVGDHWRIVFDVIKLKEGNKKLIKLSTADVNNRGFEDVIREAALGLRIEFGNGTETALEPWSDDYPSAVYISHARIALILRPPIMSWNLNEVKESPTITFYGRNYPFPLPSSFSVRSLDPALALNQTIQMDWKRRTKNTDYDVQMNPQFSGPHKLRVSFVPAGQGPRYKERKESIR